MRTFSRVNDSYGQAQRAVTDLEAAGISSANISLVANRYVSEKYENVADALAAGTGAEIASILPRAPDPEPVLSTAESFFGFLGARRNQNGECPPVPVGGSVALHLAPYRR